MPSNTVTLKARWQSALASRVRNILAYAATASARIIILALATLVLVYLLFVSVWQPLLRPGELPSGITPTNPELDQAVLQEITTAQNTREQPPRRNFIRAVALFGPRGN